MGQAKKRGTFEERKAEAQVRDEALRAEQILADQARREGVRRMQAEREGVRRMQAEREKEEAEYQAGRRRHAPAGRRLSHAALLAVAMLGGGIPVGPRR